MFCSKRVFENLCKQPKASQNFLAQFPFPLGGISPPPSSRNLNGKPCWVHKKYDQNSKTDNIVQLAKAGKITLQS